MVGDELSENHDHHDTGGKIVEDGREEEGKDSDTPEERTLRLGLHHLANPVESAVLVNDFHDGHRTHQEEECCSGIAQMFLDDSGHLLHHSSSTACIIRVHQLEILHWIHHVESPTTYQHQQGYRCLVYLSQAFGSYECIAEHENDNNRNCKCSHYFLFIIRYSFPLDMIWYPQLPNGCKDTKRKAITTRFLIIIV